MAVRRDKDRLEREKKIYENAIKRLAEAIKIKKSGEAKKT